MSFFNIWSNDPKERRKKIENPATKRAREKGKLNKNRSERAEPRTARGRKILEDFENRWH